MKQREGIIIWPAYLDAIKNRSEGRRIKKSLTVESPTLIELEKCATLLGLNPVAVSEASYPTSWWEKSGLIIVKKTGKKTILIRDLAGKLQELRASSLPSKNLK